MGNYVVCSNDATFVCYLIRFNYLSSIVHRPVDIRNRPRIPIPDEDPYSVAENGGSSGSGSSGFGHSGGYVANTREQLMMQSQQYGRRSDKPPKLPPRDNLYSHEKVGGYRVSFIIILIRIFEIMRGFITAN